MDLHRLRLLRELAARGTITAVADALAYTPSAVSQQLRTLETEIGTPLLERQGRRLVFTAAGRALVAGADGVFESVEAATSAAAAAATRIGGTVDLGAFASVGATVVPAALSRIEREHPDLVVRVTHGAQATRRELELGHLDVLLEQVYSVLPRARHDRLVEHEVLVEPVGLAVPAEEDAGSDLSAYRERAWVGGPGGSACRQLLDRLSADAGFAPDVRHLTEDVEVTLQLVAAGLAVAVLPRLATTRLPDGVAVHPLAGVTRRVVAITRAASVDRPGVGVVLAALQQAGGARQDD